MSEPTTPTDPGGAWLSAADVAAIARDHRGCKSDGCVDARRLCDQDARWRALVETLVATALPWREAWEALATVEATRGQATPLARPWLEALAAAQAALDDEVAR